MNAALMFPAGNTDGEYKRHRSQRRDRIRNPHQVVEWHDAGVVPSTGQAGQWFNTLQGNASDWDLENYGKGMFVARSDSKNSSNADSSHTGGFRSRYTNIHGPRFRHGGGRSPAGATSSSPGRDCNVLHMSGSVASRDVLNFGYSHKVSSPSSYPFKSWLNYKGRVKFMKHIDSNKNNETLP